MKLTAKTKKILKILTISVLALAEIYVIYASAASMYTYNQHPKFMSADGQVAQSSGYRTQFYLCLAFAIAIPIIGATLSYFFWLKKPKAVTDGISTGDAALGVAATDDADKYEEKLLPDIDGALDNLSLNNCDDTRTNHR